MQRKRKISSGFTIIELLIVVVILLIIAAMAIPNYIALKNRALVASVKANMHSVQAATEEFNVLAGSEYPGDIDTRVGQIYPFPLDPNVANLSLAAGVRMPPFPATALLRPHPGFKNPFSIHFQVIENLLVPPPPVPPANIRGCVYYSSYLSDRITPSAHGQPAVSYIITGYGAKDVIQISLP